ncbi:MAG: hypothetical protein Udaeo2_25480 [Candidatus Udaeobacter sp.]|nr:MAG: hypothetical protein Udaeo2_25480 [Candidatus Udaeobacter sp.]
MGETIGRNVEDVHGIRRAIDRKAEATIGKGAYRAESGLGFHARDDFEPQRVNSDDGPVAFVGNVHSLAEG